MKALREAPRCFDFSFHHLDTLLHVEELDGSVTIRASRDTFSTRRKVNFIHELAAEGFIPDEYMRSSSIYGGDNGRGVTWLVDTSWIKLDEAAAEGTRRFMIKAAIGAVLLFGALVAIVSPRFAEGPGRGSPATQDGLVAGSHWQK
jgi:hypothetical protein